MGLRNWVKATATYLDAQENVTDTIKRNNGEETAEVIAAQDKRDAAYAAIPRRAQR